MAMDIFKLVALFALLSRAISEPISSRRPGCDLNGCIQQIEVEIKNGLNVLKDCGKALLTDGEQGGVACVTDLADTALARVDKSTKRMCGREDNVIGRVGPNSCADYRPNQNQVLPNRKWMNYVMHCGNTFSIDGADAECAYDCGKCAQCQTNCNAGTWDDPAPEPTLDSSWSDTSIDYVTSKDYGAGMKRDAKDWDNSTDAVPALVKSRAARPDASDSLGTARLRADDYANICWGMPIVFMIDNDDNSVAPMGKYHLTLPSPMDQPTAQINNVASAIWACDHILELNFLDSFLGPGDGPYQLLVQMLDGTRPEYGQNINWATWEDYAVAGVFLYLVDQGVQQKYFQTAERIGNALSDIKEDGDNRNITNLFVGFARTRLDNAITIASAEVLHRGVNHSDGRFMVHNQGVEMRVTKKQKRDPDYRPNGDIADEDPNKWIDPSVQGIVDLGALNE
ncbi:MAG: hypothetical protein Q9227_000095 [Pyrenula ochraceoflavens]